MKDEEKYHILFDYGSYEGMKFYDEKSFNTVDEAIKFAVGLGYSTTFIIVKILWQPTHFTDTRKEGE